MGESMENPWEIYACLSTSRGQKKGSCKNYSVRSFGEFESRSPTARTPKSQGDKEDRIAIALAL